MAYPGDWTTCFTLAALILVAGLLGCSSTGGERAPEVVDWVDLERYVGTWYDVASFPIRPQSDCVGTTATYSFRDDGDIRVYNRCYEDSFDGDVQDIEGKAWVDDPSTNAKLKVQFFWPFRSPYWIIDLDQDAYQWAVVSGPKRDNLWILSRSPCMDPTLFARIYDSLAARGFALSRLQSTRQRSPDGEICQVELP